MANPGVAERIEAKEEADTALRSNAVSGLKSSME
jgi:hypothetical protein